MMGLLIQQPTGVLQVFRGVAVEAEVGTFGEGEGPDVVLSGKLIDERAERVRVVPGAQVGSDGVECGWGQEVKGGADAGRRRLGRVLDQAGDAPSVKLENTAVPSSVAVRLVEGQHPIHRSVEAV